MLLFVWIIVVGACVNANSPRVHTSQGTIVGSYYQGVERYAGIPYALPPIGSRRFARAILNEEKFKTEFDATKLGAPCIQNPIGDPRPPSLHGTPPPSEDCLTLNIFKPQNVTSTSQVMVWLFGGGLCTGTTSNHYFDGTVYAKEHGIIVVVVSYRLGALGFLPLQDEQGKMTGGMNGLYDVIVALKWIQKNIHAFGGDANDVTLFGQSSGGYATCTLSVSPKSESLMSRVIIQSGPCGYGPKYQSWGPMNSSYAKHISERVMSTLNCDSIECLRSIEDPTRIHWPDDIMNFYPYFSGYFEDHFIVPKIEIDDDEEESSVLKRWRKGLLVKNLDLILGFTNKDGTAAFYGTAPYLGQVPPDPKETSKVNYTNHMKVAWGSDADKVMKQYPISAYNSSIQAAFIQADADAYVICPTLQLARDASTVSGRNVYVYEFAVFHPNRDDPRGFGCDNGVELDVVSAFDPVTTTWASHGSEVQFVFGTEHGSDGLGPPNNYTTCRFSDSERALSDTMMRFWSAFARSGNPNTNSSIPWRRFLSGDDDMDNTSSLLLLREDHVENVRSRHAENCKFWMENFY